MKTHTDSVIDCWCRAGSLARWLAKADRYTHRLPRRTRPTRRKKPAKSKPGKKFPAAPTSRPQPSGIAETTLSDILAGRFPSATDKHGANGTLVRVVGLTVKETKLEADGDTHVIVTDGRVPVFICEITPVEKAAGMTDPPTGSDIEVTGYVFCDKAHETEAWHGNTCYELHPITAWRKAVA